MGRATISMSLEPLRWSEIDAYGRSTGVLTEPWEMQAVRDMSVAYLDGLKRGENPLGKPPWEG